MRLIVFVLCVELALTSGLKKPPKGFLHYQDPDNVSELYEEFKVKYDKTWANYDDGKRYDIFRDNLRRIEQFQSMEQGSARYGITEFSDLTEEEFSSLHLMPNLQRDDHPITKLGEQLQDIETPDSVDWRSKGAVTPVERQGSCGSCWAFSAVGNIESQWFRKTGKLIPLSKQQLVDCDTLDHGCSGGWPSLAYEAIKRMGGIHDQKKYPYNGRAGKCSIRSNEFIAHVNGSLRLPVNEKIQATWLAENGPMSVAVNANMLQFYWGGVTHPWSWFCSPSGLNHAVLTVGYGNEKGKPYWIVKNSWGRSWGENGYFRMYRGDGTCGIDQVVTSSIIE